MSFRILGVASLGGGLYAFYDFGKELLPLFSQSLKGPIDAFEVWTVLSSFFLGVVALILTGIRLVGIQSFSHGWLYVAIFPLVAWLERLYDIGTFASLGSTLSHFVVYMCTYGFLLSIVLFVHARWFVPLSHVSGRQIGLEKPQKSFIVEYRWAIILVVLLTLVIFNPVDAVGIFNEAVSMIVYIFYWLQG